MLRRLAVLTRRIAHAKPLAVSALSAAPAINRLWWGALIAFALAIRLMTPAGYMPAVEHGRLMVAICDDGGAPAAAHHHHGSAGGHHEPCPYTSVSSFGAAGGGITPVPIPSAPIAAFRQSVAHVAFETRRSHERPPSRGPPLPA